MCRPPNRRTGKSRTRMFEQCCLSSASPAPRTVPIARTLLRTAWCSVRTHPATSVHSAFIVLLVGVLVASAVSFLVMGLLHHLRTGALARRAHEMAMQFSRDDPFDLPRILSDFALVASGHSPRAENVTYGHLDGRVARAFDFRYEVGHGTGRMTRHYSVITVEARQELDSMLMWHEDDAPAAPISLRLANRRLGRWLYQGSRSSTEAFGQVCANLDRPLCMETRGKLAMVFIAVRGHGQAYVGRIHGVWEITAGIVEALSRIRTRGDDGDSEDDDWVQPKR